MKKILLSILMGTYLAAPMTLASAASASSGPSVVAGYSDGDLAPIRNLTKRVVPSISNQIVFETIETPADTFSISGKEGKVLIKGNNPISMAVGLNNYLRRYMGVNVSWYADDPVQVTGEAVVPSDVYGAKAAVPDRFFLNYCTFGYTMPFWHWEEWERFIDWMALNGINLPLAMTGQEKAWYLTWKDMGLTDEEILSSFTGPAHLPWHWMNNIDHFQGPLTFHWLNSQEALQKDILGRERELGMKPVLPAFAGHVPLALKNRYPEANITLRSDWSNFPDEDRCYFLNPGDSLYGEIQKRYLAIQDSIFGTDHIYGIDPFNEIDSPDWSEGYLKGASEGIFKTLREADPEAKWLQMTWNFYYDRKNWTKPRIKAFLDGVPGDDMLLLDYYCDAAEVWKRSDSYFGKPYIWCYLGNFGGNTMLAGNIGDIDAKIAAVVKEGGDNLVGFGGTLEGFDCNPVMHEYIFAKAWNPEMTGDDWVNIWARSRGGDKAPEIVEAWKLMADSIYINRTGVGQGCHTNARPTLKERTGNYANPKYKYTDENLLNVLDLLLSAKGVEGNAAYRFDVMNVTRQLLGNRFGQLRDDFTAAYEAGDVAKAKGLAVQMDELLLDLDILLATDPDFSMAKWIADARSYGTDEKDADRYEKNARTLVTIWSPPGLKLNDYANRQWSGLMKSFYRGRWNQFTDAVIASMEKGEPFDQPAFIKGLLEWEGKWIDQKDRMTPISDENPVDISRKLRRKYFQK